MSFTITSLNNERTFTDKEIVNISSQDGADYKLDVDFDYILAVQYDTTKGKYILLNQFNNNKFLFKGQPIGTKLEIDKACKIMIAGTNEFISIKVNSNENHSSYNVSSLALKEEDLRDVYGNDSNNVAKVKINKIKDDIEAARVAIIKQVSYSINDLTHKISMNSKTGIILHIALFFASMLMAFGVSNYLMGLPLNDLGTVIQMPTNLKLMLMYSVLIYVVGLVLKQGIFLFFQNKISEQTVVSSIAEKFMIVVPSIFYMAVYFINVLYYISPQSFPIFAILISLFFVFTGVILAVACGYFKSNNVEMSKKLNKYEYREDFEKVIKNYQQWIELFINNLSGTKINNIKDKLFNLQIKSVGETVLGIFTAPFLAYGVSNTLAMCFPEAAGWVRISGLRFSPVFLVLATFLIIFAFFAFVNAFLCNKKMQGSNVLKQDGFSNYFQHGVDIFGLAGMQKLNVEMRRSFLIAIVIIFIEFSMNISYFTQEIGGDIGGMFLSAVAALVPTSLLIAETYMLSQTKFEISACEELLAKIDKD